MAFTTGIYLEVGAANRPTSDDWISYFSFLRKSFLKSSIEPNYYLEGNSVGRNKYKRYIRNTYDEQGRKDLSDIEIVALVESPPGLRNATFHWTSSCSVAFTGGYDRISLEFLVEDSRVPFGGSSFRKLVQACANLTRWDFGYCMSRDRDDGIELYLSGGGVIDGMSEADERHIDEWYACSKPPERRRRIRDVFPYNMITAHHLDRTLADGRSLRAFIEGDADSELSRLNDELWLWTVRPDRTGAVRDQLRGSDLVVVGG